MAVDSGWEGPVDRLAFLRQPGRGRVALWEPGRDRPGASGVGGHSRLWPELSQGQQPEAACDTSMWEQGQLGQ